MGNRPRIVKPNAQQKAHAAVRELYSDIFDNLSYHECNLIIKARIDGLGTVFIADIIRKHRESKAQYHAETQRIYQEIKNAQTQA